MSSKQVGIKDGQCADLGHGCENGNKENIGRDIKEPLIELLLRQAIKDEELISQMAGAVRQGDKERVFELAKELTHVNA
jgi:hypothetical protein